MRFIFSIFVSLFFTNLILANDVCNCKGYAGGVGGPCYAGIGGDGANCQDVCK